MLFAMSSCTAVISRVLPVGDVALRYADAIRVGVGEVISVRVTVKLAVPGFPAASVAVQVTVVVPTGNDEPGGGIHVGVNGREYVPVEFVIMSFAVGRL